MIQLKNKETISAISGGVRMDENGNGCIPPFINFPPFIIKW